ncbi:MULTISPECIES: shufflon system plasmid conjugative transfer pilus tip adhesin PilV, partial [Enterobacteriaceae]
RLYTGEYLQLERTAVAGASCSPNGLVGRDNTGAILSCQSGTWKSSSASIWTNIKTFTLYPKNTQVLGRFKLCINTYRIDGREMAETEVVPIDMPDSNGEMTWQAKNYTQYSSYFMKITCLK